MLKGFFIKLKSWEYWPTKAVYFSVFFLYLWSSIKARSFFYFAAANPGIKNGGLGGASKMDILNLIEKKPPSILFQNSTSLSTILNELSQLNLSFPLVAKPDFGERGYGVKILRQIEDLETYLNWVPMPFIIQELIDLPVEAGVFYSRLPDETKGTISSIVIKEMLSITGNGMDTLEDLIKNNDRAFLQLDKLKSNKSLDLTHIPINGEKITLNTIGNHCLGTTFLNGNDLISDKMVQSFDTISKSIPGFYYGRFDVKCHTLEDLTNGNVIILELNGAMSEPAHIYAPGYSFLKGQQSLWMHWNRLYKIAKKNHKNGVPYLTFFEGLKETISVIKFNRKYKS